MRYLSLGRLPPKRHTALRARPGYKNEGIFYEEVVSTEGFARAYSIVYHVQPPTRTDRSLNTMSVKTASTVPPVRM